jgi:ABC-type nickel/cobalt efflux system permease component RcnA
MMEYIYFVIIIGIGLWSLVNTLDDHAKKKRQERQQIASNIARMNLRNSDKQFTYDVEPPVGLAKGVEEGV